MRNWPLVVHLWTMRNNAVLVSGAGAQVWSGKKTEGVRQHGWILEEAKKEGFSCAIGAVAQ